MRLDGRLGDDEGRGYLVIGRTAGDVREDLELAARQALQRFRHTDVWRRAADVLLDEPPGEGRRKQALAGRDGLDAGAFEQSRRNGASPAPDT